MATYTQSEVSESITFEALEAGRYPFEVIEATEGLSKAGNDKIELKMKVIGMSNHVWDNLVFVPKASWKIDQFLAATGHTLTPGEEVEVQEDALEGLKGVFEVEVEEGMNGKPRNTVARYVLPKDYDAADTACMKHELSKASAPVADSEAAF